MEIERNIEEILYFHVKLELLMETPTWRLEKKTFALIYTWAISRNQSTEKQNFIIHLFSDGIESMGEIAPNVRYGESPESIQGHFEDWEKHCPEMPATYPQLAEMLYSRNYASSFCFGIESAWWHWQSKKQQIPVHKLLGQMAPKMVATSYTVPIMDPAEVVPFRKKHDLDRFKYLKIKLNQEMAKDLIQEASRGYSGIIRLDGNEAWTDPDSLMRLLESVKGCRIEWQEQPFPAKEVEAYHYLKKHSDLPIILDESIHGSPDWDLLITCGHGINIKLMKAGGYQKALEWKKMAEKYHLKVLLGCMVESSLGIFSALNLSYNVNFVDLDGHFLIENEPFTLCVEENGQIAPKRLIF
jgi:L-alanine-DL-glutamate epimerase-like enolase superfamily enzyme